MVRMQRKWLGATFGAAIAIAAITSGVATAEPPVPQQQQQQGATDEPLKYRLADVCEFRVEHNHLVLKTKLPALRRIRTLSDNIEGLPGTSTLRIERGDPASDEPPVFYLINNNPNVEGASLVQTQVSCSNGQISIHQHRQLTDGWQVVTFTQGGDGSDDDANGGGNALDPYAVTLTVTRSQDAGHRINCTAPDWTTFRRACGPEVERYVRPLFRSLRQDDVFAVDPAVAWQVFEADAKFDPTVGDRVRQLLPKLGDEDFAQRHNAVGALMNEGVPAMLFLRKMHRGHLSAEQSNRLDAFLAGFTVLSDEEAADCRSDVNFLLDCLYCRDAAVRTAALTRLAAVTHQGLVSPPEARLHETVAQWRRELARAGRQD